MKVHTRFLTWKKTSTKFYWRIWDGGKKEKPTGRGTADTSCFSTCDSNIPTSPPQVLHSWDHMAPASCQQHWADGGQKNPAKLDPSLQQNQSGPGQTRVQPSVPMEMSVWQVAESSHTDSTRLKCRKPSAKPQPTSDRWCFPNNTRDTPTRKAHRQSRILRGTWRTGGGHTWIRFVNCSSLCYLWSSKLLTASTRWFSRNLDTMTARLAWAAGNEYISMAM